MLPSMKLICRCTHLDQSGPNGSWSSVSNNFKYISTNFYLKFLSIWSLSKNMSDLNFWRDYIFFLNLPTVTYCKIINKNIQSPHNDSIKQPAKLKYESTMKTGCIVKSKPCILYLDAKYTVYLNFMPSYMDKE